MLKKALLPLALALASGATNAGIITNDTDILTGDDHAHLSEWLGSNFDLTRIFAKGIDGDDSYDWHAAVDGKGPTFTVMEIFDNDTNERLVVGGYTDKSWSSKLGWDSSLNSFLFSLSNDILYEKNERYIGGRYAMLNHSAYGIVFGGAHDIRVNDDLTMGTANIGHTYGDMSQYGQASYQAEFAGSLDNWTIGAYETFTLSASTGEFGVGAVVSNVPASFLLGGLGLFGLMASRRNSQ